MATKHAMSRHYEDQHKMDCAIHRQYDDASLPGLPQSFTPHDIMKTEHVPEYSRSMVLP